MCALFREGKKEPLNYLKQDLLFRKTPPNAVCGVTVMSGSCELRAEESTHCHRAGDVMPLLAIYLTLSKRPTLGLTKSTVMVQSVSPDASSHGETSIVFPATLSQHGMED